MSKARFHPLVVALAAVECRREAADELAAALGCESLALFVQDPSLDLLLPAPGLPKTLAGGPLWRELLARCNVPGRYQQSVDMPRDQLRPAIALAQDGVAAVLLGGSPDAVGLDVLEAELPLLGALLRSEQELWLGSAAAAEAREAASRAHALARSLDAARAASAELNQQLRQEHERKDEFLAMLAHELRNPLSPLVNSVEILRRVDRDSPMASRQLEVMGRQLGQLTRLVDDLLDVSRVSRGVIELRREYLPLGEVLQAAVESVRPALDARGHRLQVMGLESGEYINGDRVRLIQVFSNLLQNAVKYTDPGGSISVGVVADSGRVSVVVRDTGIGIPAEMLPRVFDLFSQAPVALDRSQGGLGIGLTLVRTLVELHGGHVSAHSVGVGRGSTFTVSLPRVAAPAAAAAPETAPSRAAVTQARVLVVDDNDDSADSLAEVLRMMGAEAVVARDGMQALDLASRHGPQLVLLDIGLPGMDGYETARRLRRQQTAPMQLVALTGYGSPEDRERSRDAGFDDHLVKPVAPDVIEQLLAGLSA